jgi:ketosteroid isomerase-like protein
MTEYDDAHTVSNELAAQVRELHAESQARRLLGRYMFLCDAPLPAHRMSEQQRGAAIAALFADDAVWEGVGGAHGAQFGRKVGPAAIAEHMTAFFGVQDPRLVFNTHYLCTECLVASTDAAEGTWVQFQPWIYDDGTSVLRSSRLQVRFRNTAAGWRIAHYRTENLFVAELPVDWTASLIGQSVLLDAAEPALFPAE